jgi:hypothetical protein
LSATGGGGGAGATASGVAGTVADVTVVVDVGVVSAGGVASAGGSACFLLVFFGFLGLEGDLVVGVLVDRFEGFAGLVTAEGVVSLAVPARAGDEAITI